MDFKDAIEKRRAINFFDQTKKVEDKVIEEIINMSVLTPSEYNLQPWRIIAVKSDEAKQKLFPLTWNQPKILDSTVTLMIIGKTNSYKRDNPIWDQKIKDGKMTEESVKELIEGTMDGYLYSTEIRKNRMSSRSAGILGATILYAAQQFGVESHPMSGFQEEKIKEAFHIKDDENIELMICLGYFDQTKTLYPREKRYQYNEITEEV